jgi:2'-hydroxyisoflavone reductase
LTSSANALVIGGLGWVGRRVTAALLSRGFQVTVLDSSGSKENLPFETIRGDRHVREDLSQAVGRGKDLVFDLIAYNGNETALAVKTLAGRIGRFVHLSTISIYSGLERSPATEADAVLKSPQGTSYGAGKRRCEQTLLNAFAEHRFPAVILRSAPMFGPGDSVSRERYFLDRLRLRQEICHPGPRTARALMLCIDDLVEALIASALRPAVEGRAFHLAQQECPTLVGHVERIAELAGTPPPRWCDRPAPELIHSGFQIFAFPYALGQDAALDITAARSELGVQPGSYADRLEQTVKSLLEERGGPSWPGRGTTQSRLCGTHEWLHADQERRYVAGHLPLEGVPALELLTSLEEGSPEVTFVTDDRYEEIRHDAAWPRAATDSSGKVIVVPAALANRFPGPTNSSAGLIGAPLAAVLVAGTANKQNGYDLFVRPGARLTQEYGYDHFPSRVRVVGFGELALDHFRTEVDTLATIRGKEDRAAFERWIDACRKQRQIVVPSLETFSRVYVAGRLAREGAFHGCWSAVFSVARALLRLEYTLPPSALVVRIACPGSCLFDSDSRTADTPLRPLRHPWILCSVVDRFLLIDVRTPRILELPPVLAVVADVAGSVNTMDEAIRELQKLIQLPFESARRTLLLGLEQLDPILRQESIDVVIKEDYEHQVSAE